MPVKIEVKQRGIASATRRLRGLTPQETPEIVSRAMRASAEEIRRVARDRYMSGPSSRTRLGERTGNLKASLALDTTKLPYQIRVGSGLVYAPIHEFGRSGARSYLRRALRASGGFITKTFKESWERELRGDSQ